MLQMLSKPTNKKIGDLEDLVTENKDSIVDAINEVASSSGGSGSKLIYAGLVGRLFEGEVDIHQNDVLVFEYYVDDRDSEANGKYSKIKVECIVNSFTFNAGAGTLTIKNAQLTALTTNNDTFSWCSLGTAYITNYTINIVGGAAGTSLVNLVVEYAPATDASRIVTNGYAYLIRP